MLSRATFKLIRYPTNYLPIFKMSTGVTTSNSAKTGIDTVLDFWFQELTPQQHFMKDEKVDNVIKNRYGYLIDEIKSGKHDNYKKTPLGNLTLIIVLDQFSRNIYRGSSLSFAQDDLALKLSKEGIARGDLEEMPSMQHKAFLCMPYMHSETLQDQNDSVELFSKISELNHEFAIKHQVIIEKFGRFPHRNEILNRFSSPEEIQFLTQENSSF